MRRSAVSRFPSSQRPADETHEAPVGLDFGAADDEVLDDQRFGERRDLALGKEALQHGGAAVMMRGQSRRTRIAASSRETFLSVIYLGELRS